MSLSVLSDRRGNRAGFGVLARIGQDVLCLWGGVVSGWGRLIGWRSLADLGVAGLFGLLFKRCISTYYNTGQAETHSIAQIKTEQTISILLWLVPVWAEQVWPRWSSLHSPSHSYGDKQNNLSTHSSDRNQHHDNWSTCEIPEREKADLCCGCRSNHVFK